MSFFETMALRLSPVSDIMPPFFWIRYVDDVLAIFSDADQVAPFLAFLNSLRPSIRFTVEMEVDGSISFLDMSITRVCDRLSFSVFRKPTHTDRYLNRRSCHPGNVFKGLVSCLKKRALSVCSHSEVGRELSHLRKTFVDNGYSREDLRSLCVNRTEKAVSSEQPTRVVLPFYPGLAHRLRRVFRRAGVRVAFKSSAPLRNIISRRKPDSFPKKGLVYRIPCSQCDWSYIGETGRTLKDRLSEHRRACLLYTSPSPRDLSTPRMPSSA